MIGVLVALLFAGIVKRSSKIRKRTIVRIIVALIIGVIIFFTIDYLLLNGLFSAMLFSSVSGMLSLSDTSALKHLQDLIQPIINVVDHPFGLGFGNNGQMALEKSQQAVTVESSYYLMLYEVGIVGTIFCFAPYFSVVYNTVKNRAYNYFVPACAVIVCLFTYLLLPNIQTYEVTFYAYLFIGLYNNKSVVKIFREKNGRME